MLVQMDGVQDARGVEKEEALLAEARVALLADKVCVCVCVCECVGECVCV